MIRKLKTDRGIQGLIPAITSLLIFFLSAIVFNLHHAFNILGGIMIFYAVMLGFWAFYKTGNYYFLVTFFYLLSFGLLLIFLDLPRDFSSPAPKFTSEMKAALLFVYFFMFWLIYAAYKRTLRYKGRQVMELAAWDVDEGPETNTERPRPAGVVDYSKYDIITFADFYMKDDKVRITYRLNSVKMGLFS